MQYCKTWSDGIKQLPGVPDCETAFLTRTDFIERVHHCLYDALEDFSRFIVETPLKHPAMLDMKSRFALQRIKDTTALPLIWGSAHRM